MVVNRRCSTIRPAAVALLIGLSGITPSIAAPMVALELLVGGLSQPVFATHAGDGSGRLFVVEKAGRIQILDRGLLHAEPFLDIADQVLAGGEQGLLGLAFHPAYATNGRYFVDYTRQPDGASVIAEYGVSADPDRSDSEERVLLTVAQPFANHNGGMLAFGAGGRLFIGLGDGGSGGDPGDRAQDRDQLLGKILRIDVDGAHPYAIPEDNPFAAGGGRPEIYALGLRNPWRFSVDRDRGYLFAGDVGQGRREEIDLIFRGGNYGWPILEGNLCFRPAQGCSRADRIPPLTEYPHLSGRCSVTGGYVYRGSAIPELHGSYVFADFCSGDVLRLSHGWRSVLLQTDLRISSFGEDEAGELLVVDHGGGAIHRIVAATP